MAKKPTIKIMYTSVNRTIYSDKDNDYEVVHYVGAVSTAKANAQYFKSKYRGASANFFVDENEIWCVVPVKYAAWHCGGGSQGSGGKKFFGKCKNANSIGIELCCKKDKNGKLYIPEKTLKRAAQLVQWLQDEYDIPDEHIIRHYDVTGKRCPAPYITESKWKAAKKILLGYSANSKPTVPSKTLVKGDTGNAVETLQELMNWFIGKKLVIADKLDPDGSFGKLTKAVVKKWQKAAKKKGYYTGEIDGQFGPKSRAAAKTWLADL